MPIIAAKLIPVNAILALPSLNDITAPPKPRTNIVDTIMIFLVLLKSTLLSTSALRSILMVLITIILAYFTLVFGELVPKRVAISDPYKTASRYVNVIIFAKVFFYPLVKLLTISTEGICRLFNVKRAEICRF